MIFIFKPPLALFPSVSLTDTEIEVAGIVFELLFVASPSSNSPSWFWLFNNLYWKLTIESFELTWVNPVIIISPSPTKIGEEGVVFVASNCAKENVLPPIVTVPIPSGELIEKLPL